MELCMGIDGFVEARICEALDKTKSDCDSKGMTPLQISMNSRDLQ